LEQSEGLFVLPPIWLQKINHFFLAWYVYIVYVCGVKKETVAIRLEPDTIQRIKQLAEKDQRTVSDYLRLFLEKEF